MTGFIDARLKLLLVPAVASWHAAAPVDMVRTAWRIIHGDGVRLRHSINGMLAFAELRQLLGISEHRWDFVVGRHAIRCCCWRCATSRGRHCCSVAFLGL